MVLADVSSGAQRIAMASALSLSHHRRGVGDSEGEAAPKPQCQELRRSEREVRAQEERERNVRVQEEREREVSSGGARERENVRVQEEREREVSAQEEREREK